MERLCSECRQDVQPVGSFFVNGLEVSIIAIFNSGQRTFTFKVLTSQLANTEKRDILDMIKRGCFAHAQPLITTELKHWVFLFYEINLLTVCEIK